MKPIRWWPAALILALALAGLAYFWLSEQSQRQDRMVGTIVVTLLSFLLLTLWLLFLSRIPWKRRLLIFGGVALAVAAFFSLVRIEGVSGDWIPQLAWRWDAGSEAVGRRDRPAPVPAAPDPAAEVDSPHDFPRQEFPQFLGPERNATVRGVRLARDWEIQPPQLVWRMEVGPAWSGFAVADGVAVTQEQRGPLETVVAYGLESGEQLWSWGAETRLDTSLGGSGPRATPTIAGGRVYASGGRGLLSCLDVRTGELRWSRDVLAEAASRMPEWGKSASPLVVGDLVVVTGGMDDRSLLAYDRETGEPRWRAGVDGSSYASPLLAELGGVAQIVILNRASVSGHDPADGAVLWRRPWPSAGQPVVAQPLPLDGDRLLVSSGYGVGAKLFEIHPGGGGLEAETVWESPRMKVKFSQMVEHEGTVYGLDDGVMVALDPETGERRWKRGRYGHGQILLVEDLLLVQSERGEVILIEPRPEELRELGRFRAVRGKAWNTMALAGPYLLVRTAEDAACYRLPLA